MAVGVLSEKAWKRTKAGYLKGKLIQGNIKDSKIGSNFYYLYSLQANYKTYKTVCSCNGWWTRKKWKPQILAKHEIAIDIVEFRGESKDKNMLLPIESLKNDVKSYMLVRFPLNCIGSWTIKGAASKGIYTAFSLTKNAQSLACCDMERGLEDRDWDPILGSPLP